ncbi:MAG: glycerol-3-phosphate acyltransferase [Chloroflexi bacterium]|nr:glycerol-3-phosphate acyltransferase [Chloroflexota bacterium]
MNFLTFISIVVGYLIGSISFPQIVAKLAKGIDLREVGSKNVGGRNTFFSVGLGWGILAGVLDALKGVSAIVASRALGLEYSDYIWAGLGAVAGHNWPVWLGFRGGKGISVVTGLAVWFAFPQALLSLIIGLSVLAITSNMIISSSVGFILLLALLRIQEFENEIFLLFGYSVIIMLISILPYTIKLIRTPDGIRDYFRDPDKGYRDGGEKNN